jgi:uncharacterized RDD family membrane protein YckC
MPLPHSQGWTYSLRHGEREIPVADGDIVLGRSHAAGVRVDEETVSRSHALLSLREGKAVIRDLGSSNGLFVAGRRVVGQTPVSDGETIGLGSAELVLSITPPADFDLRTAMIPTLPAGGRSRPSETVTRFPLTPDEGAALLPAPEPLLPARAPRRPRSADDVLLWGDPGEASSEPEVPAAPFARASLGARLASAVLDLLFAAGIAFICFVPALVAIVTHASLRLGAGSSVTFWALVGFCSAMALVAVGVYFLSGWAGRGATPGQRVAGVKLVATGEGLVTSGRGLMRLAGLLLYLGTGGLLALSVLFDAERRGLADKMSGSRVIPS